MLVGPANARWLLTSGTPGLTEHGELPKGIEEQAERAWQHIVAMLAEADMELSDVVKINQYLTNVADIEAYGKVRSRI